MDHGKALPVVQLQTVGVEAVDEGRGLAVRGLRITHEFSGPKREPPQQGFPAFSVFGGPGQGDGKGVLQAGLRPL